jgi:ribosome-associated translation inhibitor RaiA
MQKRIVFKDMDHSQPLEDHANKQLQRIIRFLELEGRTPIYLDLFLEPSKVHAHHRVELLIKTPQYDRSVHYESPDMYGALDRVVDTMYLKLHEDKRRHHDDNKMVGRHDEFKKQR